MKHGNPYGYPSDADRDADGPRDNKIVQGEILLQA